MSQRFVTRIQQRAVAFRDAAQSIFAKYEASRDRVITLTESRKTLSNLSIAQNLLFDQALKCTDNSLFRAAHVMAWAAFMDFLHERLASDGFARLHRQRPNLSKCTSLDELREGLTDYECIRVAHDLKIITKQQMKTLHGLLSERNQCAHPGPSEPTLNETLGFISKLFRYIKEIQQRTV